MLDWEWWKTRILPYFVIAGLSAVITSMWLAGTGTLKNVTMEATQQWVPKGAFIFSNSSENCPSGGWVHMGRVLVQVHNEDAGKFDDGDRNFVFDEDHFLKGFTAMELRICKKGN